MAMTTQPVDDEDDDNAVINDNDDDEDADNDDNEDNNGDNDDEDNNKIIPSSATTRTLNAMKKLATSYNPYAMDYVNCHLPSDDASKDNTIQQDNQSGREEEEDDKVKEVKSDEQIRDLNLASLAIDPLLDFAFYAKEQVEIQQLDFADAFEHHLIEPTTF